MLKNPIKTTHLSILTHRHTIISSFLIEKKHCFISSHIKSLTSNVLQAFSPNAQNPAETTTKENKLASIPY